MQEKSEHKTASPQAQAYLRQALEQAARAAELGEVPVGAVVVHGGQVIGRGHNAPVAGHDPTAHAEIVALREAARRLGNYRLSDCELYVTLEPCPMCVGAILHARVKRVVWGAPDPKAGACGSVVDLAADARLNHHTAFEGGLLADECAGVLRQFFASRRVAAGASRKVWRTPDEAFAGIADFPFTPRYLANLPGTEHVRLHYVDEGPRGAPRTFLCLHGEGTWSYLFRRMIPVLARAGCRVVAPDLVGHGRSDKFVDAAAYSPALHRRTVLALIERLDLRRVVLVGQDRGGGLALTLPMELPERCAGLLLMNAALHEGPAVRWPDRQPAGWSPGALLRQDKPDLSPAEAAAYDAPFAAAADPAGWHRWDAQDADDGEWTALVERATAWAGRGWTGRGLAIEGLGPTGVRVPDAGLPVARASCSLIMQRPDIGYFVPEWDAGIAHKALEVFG